jgi:hypothetical protein
MSTVGLTRATVLAITEEVTPGVYVAPSSGTDFVALRPGSEMSFETEKLENDELINDIGAAKSFVGKESTSGTHPAYLRHSGVEGQEPQLGKLFKSIMGSKQIASVEYDTVSGSTTKIVKVNTGEGANFVEGQALLVKNGSGYEIRNVASISGDDLTLNFALDNAPGTGVNLGKAITYIPAALAPTLSFTKYLGSGHAKEITAGNAISELSLTADANGFGEVEFSFEGTKYYFNPIVITSSNKFLDVTDDGGTIAVSVEEKIYKTPVELADALQAALEAASAETYTVTYSSTTGKFTIASGSTVLSLLWNTGANAANSIGTTLGFLVAADDTGSVSYTSDNAQTYAVPYTPSYDSSDAIVVKGVDLFLGTQTDNICVCAQSVSLTVSKTLEDVDCACEENGVLEKIPTARTAELQVTAVMKKYDVALLDALLKNSEISAMLNAGPKSGGNWVAGKCFNFYMQSCTVNSYKTTGDSFIQAEITLSGFVSSGTKDLFINFV